jgi:hypothetical protein
VADPLLGTLVVLEGLAALTAWQQGKLVFTQTNCMRRDADERLARTQPNLSLSFGCTMIKRITMLITHADALCLIARTKVQIICEFRQRIFA